MQPDHNTRTSPALTNSPYPLLSVGFAAILLSFNGLLPMLAGIEGRGFSQTFPMFLLGGAFLFGTIVAYTRREIALFWLFCVCSVVIGLGF